MNSHPILQIIHANRSGASRGIPSLCTAHPLVLETALRNAHAAGQSVLIEATCNQVNQYGGYTGMQPADFASFVSELSVKAGLAPDQLILGGDHLGPNPWQSDHAAEAMSKAETLVQAFVQAGFSKIHLDCSMHLADDDQTRPLPPEIAAERSARLAAAAEAACPGGCGLVYVIGTEVPVPGGATEQHGIQITSPSAAEETIDLTRQAFIHRNLEDAWERVVGVVVQPGVEFGDDFVLDYQPEKAAALSAFIATRPGLVYEAHSTDYQTGEHLRRMVQDHFAILKVGPELTYAYREAVFKLAQIENEIILPAYQSRVLETIEAVMLMHPDNWQKYYRGSESERAFARKYSLSDRIRYYWPQTEIRSALERMSANLASKPLPLSLLSQYFPGQYEAIRTGELSADPAQLIASQIRQVIHRYEDACGMVHETDTY